MKRFFGVIGLTLLGDALLGMGAANAAQCGAYRYKFVGTDLAANDVLSLNVGNTQISATLDANSALASEWPKVLADLLNQNISADIASAGSRANLASLNRYLPEFSVSDNIIDVKQDGVLLSLDKNNQSFDQALHQEYDTEVGYSSGSALLPSWTKRFISSSMINFINLSNITDKDITVKVKLFAQDGSVYTEASEGGVHLNNNPNNLVNGSQVYTDQGVVSGANKTISVYITSAGVQKYGYGRIEWEAEGCLKEAMTGMSIHYYGGNSYSGESQFAINGGQAF